MVEEARLEESGSGLAPAAEGWFVVNVRDAAWLTNDALGAGCFFEGDDTPFPEVGVSLRVFSPGQPHGLYHAEPNQEDFLVIAGECLLLVEDEERPLRAWDFVHCPPNTAHVFVGAGRGPCVVLMVGPRTTEVVYPRSEVALRHGAGVEIESSSPAEVLEPLPRWRLGRPEAWDELPWTTEQARRKDG
jgi:uncharacterized cupin superfamily protein